MLTILFLFPLVVLGVFVVHFGRYACWNDKLMVLSSELEVSTWCTNIDEWPQNETQGDTKGDTKGETGVVTSSSGKESPQAPVVVLPGLFERDHDLGTGTPDASSSPLYHSSRGTVLQSSSRVLHTPTATPGASGESSQAFSFGESVFYVCFALFCPIYRPID